MNRTAAFIVAVVGGALIGLLGVNIWLGLNPGSYLTFTGIAVFCLSWLAGWALIYGVWNTVMKHRAEQYDSLEEE